MPFVKKRVVAVRVAAARQRSSRTGAHTCLPLAAGRHRSRNRTGRGRQSRYGPYNWASWAVPGLLHVSCREP
ncbi:hypothetical protein [Paenibacillus taiwanensis]|uniref:hypothetical protein n=1 Tax=Paenibacillus taiwanensis TaxID=401638 RepID=UPI001FDF7DC5|nr:hypothetical protein [Paenibacillus taiwanensis]